MQTGGDVMGYSQSSKWQLIVLLMIVTLLCGACGAGVNSKVDQHKQEGAVINKPFANLQVIIDHYLKKSSHLYIEPHEVLSQVVIGEDNRYILVDIRNDEHYAFAHIPGAIHISYGDTWREEKLNYLPKDKKIIVIDYSGHTASQVAATWNMLGFEAIPMRYGMAGWSKDRDIIGGSPKGCEAYNFPVVTISNEPGTYNAPELETKAASVPELFLARAEAAIKIPPVIQPQDLKDKLKSYFIIDTRLPEHFVKGHIEGAINIPFSSIAETTSLKKIPPDKSLILVCYDGHASSQAARMLNLLGYHATALKDGMSAWVADEKIIGSKPITCAITENPVMKLNALLKPGPSTGAT